MNKGKSWQKIYEDTDSSILDTFKCISVSTLKGKQYTENFVIFHIYIYIYIYILYDLFMIWNSFYYICLMWIVKLNTRF